VLCLELQQRLRDQQREVGVLVAGRLDALIEQPLHVLPQAEPVGADHHAAAHRGVIGELRLAHHLVVPAGEVVGLVGEVFDELLGGSGFGHSRLLNERRPRASPSGLEVAGAGERDKIGAAV
jgi:hypothetical protein